MSRSIVYVFMDDIVEKYFPLAGKSDQMDLKYDYIYCIESDGTFTGYND